MPAEPVVCRRPALLIAALSDKDVSGIVDVLVPAFPRVMVTATQSDRALPVLELAKMVREKLRLLGRDEEDTLEVFDSVSDALDWCTANDAPVIAAGTITLAGEVAGLLRG